MPLSSLFKTAFVVWCVAEAVVFALCVHVFGLGWTLLAEFLIGVAGIMLLKRRGAAAMIKLRATFRGRMAEPGTNVVVEGIAVLGALALILPGFLSDLVGVALLAQPVRTRVAAWVHGGGAAALRRRRRPAGQPDVIDLEPDEWRNVDGRRPSELRP